MRMLKSSKALKMLWIIFPIRYNFPFPPAPKSVAGGDIYYT
jgi:hypothetical protein